MLTYTFAVVHDVDQASRTDILMLGREEEESLEEEVLI